MAAQVRSMSVRESGPRSKMQQEAEDAAHEKNCNKGSCFLRVERFCENGIYPDKSDSLLIRYRTVLLEIKAA